MKIKEIQIQNFRSIRNLVLSANDMNVIVGLNDVGKSNILRALNLFFNNQTDNGHSFDFGTDFAYHFPKKSKRTKETLISITFDVPNSFKDHGLITWQKSWRKSGFNDENFLNSDGNKLPSSSRIPLALKSIRYRYVPAVKSKEYYKELLVDLYKTLSGSLSIPLQESTEAFANSIKESTDSLTKALLASLNIKSVLTVPTNLQEFFKSLIFETATDKDGFTVSLDLRGDGIQARHIPQMLKFMAEEDKNSRTKGAPRVYTIWGYEEPENGLELSKAFEMAKEFSLISNEIQIFTTTHSPAFYIEATNHPSASITYIKKESTGETKVIPQVDPRFLNQELGIMPIIAPYIQETLRQLESYKQLVKENYLVDIPTVAVEGITDKEYLLHAISLYSPTLQAKLEQNKLRVLASRDCGGTPQIVQWGHAWCHAGFSSPICFLLDNDQAGNTAKKKLSDDPSISKKLTEHRMKIILLRKPPFTKDLASKRIQIPIAIEHTMGQAIWDEAETNGWLEKRPEKEIRNILSTVIPMDQSFKTFMDSLSRELPIPCKYLTHQVRNESKQAFMKRAIELSKTDASIFDNIKPTISDIESFFI